ncbi:MAG: alpha/beta fold hydrolase [Rhizobiales bacterium]|nr:alpha/beta fold hydrolase [Hyphomicrobiales bacterium]
MTAREHDGTVYEMTGPDDGAAVVLIHGLGLHRGMWRKHIPVLAKRHRVIAYDLPGHGKSALPKEPPTLRLLARQLIGLLDHLGIEKAALVGFSLGGMINRRVAIDHGHRVSALAILNSPHERGAEQQRLVEERAAATADGGPGATIDATIARWFTADFISREPEEIAAVRAAVLANDPRCYAQFRQLLAKGVVELIRPDPPIALATLVVTCENDSGSTPDMSRAIAGEIAGARVIIVPQLQHLGLIEQPEHFTGPILAFLADANA